MDINKIPNDQKLELCRWYFKVGFLCLPFVWAVNAVWFFNAGFRKPPFNEQVQIKRYVIMSAFGALVWGAAIATWITIYQLNRSYWGALGDSLTFIIPLGGAYIIMGIVSSVKCSNYQSNNPQRVSDGKPFPQTVPIQPNPVVVTNISVTK